MSSRQHSDGLSFVAMRITVKGARLGCRACGSETRFIRPATVDVQHCTAFLDNTLV